MGYDSIDILQKEMAEITFAYAKDKKKAAGRALGTIVELITYYFLKSWKLRNYLSIERKIPEFGNDKITHNVEYSLHPIHNSNNLTLLYNKKSITSHKICKELKKTKKYDINTPKNNTLLSIHGILRNSCTIASFGESHLLAFLNKSNNISAEIEMVEQFNKPFAMFECKRVGVEDGNKKGPTTIEKAKQGAYVAKSISSLYKIRLENGDLYGVVYKDNKPIISEPYYKALDKVIKSNSPTLLKNFILTVGVVSNHGNWFTADDHNKEMKVLAQSYDWLIFLTDKGIAQFMHDLVLNPSRDYLNIKKAFESSYSKDKIRNQFTKVNINNNADIELSKYFSKNRTRIENWFNVISPNGKSLPQLKKTIDFIKAKDWEKILK